MANDWCCRCMTAGVEVSGAAAAQNADRNAPHAGLLSEQGDPARIAYSIPPASKETGFGSRGIPKAKAEVGSGAGV